MKIGVFIPTSSRPDFIRHALLQLCFQKKLPNIVCVHQNGNEESYEHIISDIEFPFELKWIHTPEKLNQHTWYSIPLRYLVENECDYYFWMDHDDIYLTNHIQNSVEELQTYDFRVSNYSNMLAVDKYDYKYNLNVRFYVHAAKGMSSSMAFNKDFALKALTNIETDTKHHYTDQVIASETMSEFKCLSSDVLSTTYVVHRGSTTSKTWLTGMLGKEINPDT
jgi:hypothetical protein